VTSPPMTGNRKLGWLMLMTGIIGWLGTVELTVCPARHARRSAWQE
jgi:hypothetical protein